MLNTKAGSYSAVYCIKNRVYYTRRSTDEEAAVYVYNITNKNEEHIGEGIEYTFAPGTKKMVVKRGAIYNSH
ncbi:MAG: hypothetical protein HC896_05790 [Bacteroidales bacterium]|nr:hypothetical protein [Bacteroidales bacterium]